MYERELDWKRKSNTGLDSLLVSLSLSTFFFTLGNVLISCFPWPFTILNTLVIDLDSTTQKMKQGLFAYFQAGTIRAIEHGYPDQIGDRGLRITGTD